MKIQISKKSFNFEISQKKTSKVIPIVTISHICSINDGKTPFLVVFMIFACFVCCLPLMFSAESEIFSNNHHWICYDQKSQNWNQLVQLWTSVKNICEHLVMEHFRFPLEIFHKKKFLFVLQVCIKQKI